MNPGAFVYKKNIFSNAEITQISTLAKDLEGSKRSVHAEGGTYSSLKWFQVDLGKDLNFCKAILNELSTLDPELLVFYYLDPGAVLHPHRDLTGASLNNRIRFHVPVITNPGVEFIVNNEKIKMAPGDPVSNDGDETRVHIIIECAINEEIKRRLPGGYKAKFHNFSYALILGVSLVKAIFVNSITNPKYFSEQMGMVYKFIKWRVFKSEKPK